MNINVAAPGINPLVMREAVCAICLETVDERINQGVLEFFGHLVEGGITQSISSHIICGICHLQLQEQVLAAEIFRRCFHCNEVPEGMWQKKITLNVESNEFRVEQASVAIIKRSVFIEGLMVGPKLVLAVTAIVISIKLMHDRLSLAAGKAPSEWVQRDYFNLAFSVGFVAGGLEVVRNLNLQRILTEEKEEKIKGVVCGAIAVMIVVSVMERIGVTEDRFGNREILGSTVSVSLAITGGAIYFARMFSVRPRLR